MSYWTRTSVLIPDHFAVNTSFTEDLAKDPALLKVLQAVGLDGTKPILHRAHPVVEGTEQTLPLYPPSTSVRSVLHDSSKPVNVEFSSILSTFFFHIYFVGSSEIYILKFLGVS